MSARTRRRSAAGGTPATVAFLQFNSDTVNRTTYTFAGEDIGTPGTQRHIGVAIQSQETSSNHSVSSVKVDEESLSSAVTGTNGDNRVSLWFGAVPTGNATGDIVITFAAQQLQCLIGVFECHYVQSATATATDTETTDNTQMTAAADAGGIAIAAAAGFDAAESWTWTGSVTGHGDVNAEDSLGCASGAIASAGTATATANATVGTNYIAVLATFR